MGDQKLPKNQMSRGVVYILSNPHFPGLLKIGRTGKGATERARELSRATGVPGEFEVIYDEIVGDAAAAEKEVHRLFSQYRINPQREFFRISTPDAIRAVQSIAKKYPANESTEAEGFDVLPALEARMRRWLRRDLVSVRFIQFSDLCVIKWAVQPDLRREEAHERIFDLSIFGDWENDANPNHDGLVFSPRRNSAHENLTLFLDLDAYSMIMTGLDILSEEAANHVAALWEKLKLAPPIRPSWTIVDTTYDTSMTVDEWKRVFTKPDIEPTLFELDT